ASTLRTIPDDPFAMENFYLHQTVQGLDASPMDLAALVETVTADQVVEIARGVELDAVYFLKGEDKE
ncbi:MAG: insulinase family protein, partial [Oscillospiraceae bacterium]|nr:insulinase family protein [Oscillospiraceae bacterium]